MENLWNLGLIASTRYNQLTPQVCAATLNVTPPSSSTPSVSSGGSNAPALAIVYTSTTECGRDDAQSRFTTGSSRARSCLYRRAAGEQCAESTGEYPRPRTCDQHSRASNRRRYAQPTGDCTAGAPTVTRARRIPCAVGPTWGRATWGHPFPNGACGSRCGARSAPRAGHQSLDPAGTPRRPSQALWPHHRVQWPGQRDCAGPRWPADLYCHRKWGRLAVGRWRQHLAIADGCL